MTTTTHASEVVAPLVAAPRDRPIESSWGPKHEELWGSGRRISRRNLALSVFCENLGFSVWVLWTVGVINLADVGIRLSLGDQFVLAAAPSVIGFALLVVLVRRVRGLASEAV